MEERIQEIMDRTGLDREQAREIALRDEAAAAYQMASSPPPRRIGPADLRLPSAMPRPSPPSEPPRSPPPPSRDSVRSNAGAAECRCGGAGYLVADARYGSADFGQLVPCACTLAARERRRQAAGVLAQLHAELGRLRHCTFASFDPARPLRPAVDVGGMLWTEEAQRASLLEALAVAQSYAEHPDGWLYLHGPVGSGKSHLAAAIASARAARGTTAAYATATSLITFLKAGFGDGSADQRLVALQGVELLVIDDLGTQRAASPGEWAFAQFYELLNARYLHERPTVLTSNLPPSHLEERLRDRVEGMATELHLVAASYRQLHRYA